MNTTIKPPRIQLIDSLRGFALAGVGIVHLTQQFMNVSPPEGFMEGVDSLPDYIISGLVNIFMVGKFFALFSILFGLSFAIQMQSAENRGSNFSMRFLWRAALLFVIGYIHHLFYGGDILTIYAVLAPFIIPFYKLKKNWLLIVAAICFIGIPRFLTFALMGNNNFFGVPSMMENTNELNKMATEALFSGSLSDVFSSNAIFGLKTKFNFQLTVFGRFYYTFGYFLLGLWIGRTKLFRDLDKHIGMIKKTLKWSSILLIVPILLMVLCFVMGPTPPDFSHFLHWMGINMYDIANLLLSLIIISSFVLLYRKEKWQKRLSYFSSYGRMALTNYVLQALIGTFILYNWGLGLSGEIRTLYLFLIAIFQIFLQQKLSTYWLSNFKNGPLEWLWRCGTYLKWQPFLKQQELIPQTIEVKPNRKK